jgi:hypothetical protein
MGLAACRSSSAAILMGVLPNLFLRPMEPSVERMLSQYRRGVQTEIRAGIGTRESGFAPEARPTNPESRR